jgi:DNA polymerase III delta prime subunit
VSAYIYEGEDTKTVRNHALAFAKSLNCEASEGNSEHCNCLSCRTFDSRNHPDTFFIKGTKQSGIGVEDVRDAIILPMSTKPFKYKHKVFIVESPLTPQAQNALLKTIEEPPDYGVFLFLGSTHGFLPTVLSRCVIKKFHGEPSGEDENEEIPAIRRLAEEILQAAQGADIPEAFALYRKIEPLDKNALQEFLNSLYIHYGKKINAATQTGQPPQNWLNAPSVIAHTKQILAQNGNTQLAIELMLLQLSGMR